MNKNIVLGVTGGIAAYKAASIASRLVQLQFDTHVVMTASAQQFITPLTFQSLTKNPVITDTFMEPNVNEFAHIALADRADAILIAPTTANSLAKLAYGIADNVLTTLVLASTAPKIIALAMNVNMYHQEITQENIQRLKTRGFHIVDVVSGTLACGWIGDGRMASTEEIVNTTTQVIEKCATK